MSTLDSNRNEKVVATLTALVSLAVTGGVGYFDWWQPDHSIQAPASAVIVRTSIIMPAGHAKLTHANMSIIRPKVFVSVATPSLASPGEQLESDEDANHTDDGTSNDGN